tara:strand:- start:118 stop:591 length:474 start_codon:yes stop_codon:yes gene_type:complete
MDDKSIDVGDELDLMDWVPDKDMVSSLMSLSGWLSNFGDQKEDDDQSSDSPMAGPNRFTDVQAAQNEGFRGLIVPGNYGMMAMESAVKKWIPSSTIKKLDCVFRQPLMQGDKVQVGGVVTDRVEELDKVVLELDLYITRDDGQRPQGGTAIVVIGSI